MSTAAASGAADIRRQEIMQAAFVLFDREGYHLTSMNDIADAVGIRKPTLYHYFKTKDEILFWIRNAALDPLIAAQQDRATRGLSDLKIIEGSMRDLLAMIDSHNGRVRSLYEFHRELAPDDRVVIEAKMATFGDAIEAAMSRAIAAGIVRDIDPRVATLGLLGSVNWAHQWYGGPREQLSLEQITDILVDIFMRGILVDAK